MLRSGGAVKIDVFLYLRFAAFALGGLVYRKFNIVLAVAPHDRHQRGIFRRDVLVVKRDITEKSKHVAIKITPVAHLTQFDVADNMIDKHYASRIAIDLLRLKSRQEGTNV